VNGYHLPATCAECGGQLQAIQSSRATSTEASALAACADCDRQWLVMVRLIAVARDPLGSERQRRSRVRSREALPA
jgi:DNA-directed RNA polymerase subunit RPC12/RpoP